MRKYKKIFIGLILGLMCAILPFIGVAKVKALTVDDITTINDLRNTVWIVNQSIPSTSDSLISSNIYSSDGTTINIATFEYGENLVNVVARNDNYYNIYFSYGVFGSINNSYFRLLDENNQSYAIYSATFSIKSQFDISPRKLTFLNWSENQIVSNSESTFIELLKIYATFEGVVEEEPTTRTIPFRISLITDLFDNTLGYVNSNVIDLPVYDDTVSFTVSFQNNQMITGQINHPEADAIEELTFSNGERVFYTIYYNEANIDFKLYFYGEQLYLYEAVMYNTEVLDSSGNYQATVATYSEGISEQEMVTLKNSGIYEASFEITIPQENELVTDAQLMLEMGISSNAEPPEMENISNIMTGIFTLVSSFLSIQLGFITLGQIIGLILAIGVVFFIFYVWNGGRNGN